MVPPSVRQLKTIDLQAIGNRETQLGNQFPEKPWAKSRQPIDDSKVTRCGFGSFALSPILLIKLLLSALASLGFVFVWELGTRIREGPPVRPSFFNFLTADFSLRCLLPKLFAVRFWILDPYRSRPLPFVNVLGVT